MTIRPIDFNGMMQRSQDVSTLKQHEDQRPVIEQQHIEHKEEKKIEHRLHQVNESEKKDETQTKYDARDESKNKYFANPNAKKKKKEEKDKVTPKAQYSGGFDIKI
ncbi:MAG: hypothetical protein E7280_01710 [Lachnospiraceae bacterium]|jgi:type IV secretory pathway VirB10-like protein|nr:hypothetical protein [Lachnospiraceae bacterium]